MTHEFWKTRWAQGKTGWHQAAVEPALVRHFAGRAAQRVLVALCGKSRDLAWLAEQGHEVLGVELSELACAAFFAEQGREPSRESRGRFTAYAIPGITLLNGDFFDLDPGTAGPVDFVYDRAALIALPPALRPRYARLIRDLAPPEILQVALTRIPAEDPAGPPYSVSEAEVRALYAEDYAIRRLTRETVELGGASGAASAMESVYQLIRSPRPA